MTDFHLKYSANGHLLFNSSGHLVNDCAVSGYTGCNTWYLAKYIIFGGMFSLTSDNGTIRTYHLMSNACNEVGTCPQGWTGMYRDYIHPTLTSYISINKITQTFYGVFYTVPVTFPTVAYSKQAIATGWSYLESVSYSLCNITFTCRAVLLAGTNEQVRNYGVAACGPPFNWLSGSNGQIYFG